MQLPHGHSDTQTGQRHTFRLLLCLPLIWYTSALSGHTGHRTSNKYTRSSEIQFEVNAKSELQSVKTDLMYGCEDADLILRKPTVCQGYKAPWSSSDLKASVSEFAKLYNERPIKDNKGGVNVNHAFALWFSVKQVRPTHIIESGVNKGQTTWLLRQAAPDAQIFSLDPLPQSNLVFKDHSPKTKYLMGSSFKDLARIQWDELIGEKDRASTFVMLDDHQSSVKRVAQLLKFGFVHLYYDDNYRKDTYSFNTVCSQPVETTGMPYYDEFGKIHKNITMDEHNDLVGYFKSHLETYFEFPAIWDFCVHHPYYQSLLTKSEVQTVEGLPSLAGGNYASLYPPYVKLKVDGLSPPRLLHVEPSSLLSRPS